jgi:hypothetical protein
MNVNAGAARQTLSYVFTAAANASANASSGGVATASIASSPAPAAQPGASTPSNDTAVPAGSISAEEARQNLLDFLENPDTVHLKMMKLNPATITYRPPTSQQAVPAPPVVSNPTDPDIPLHVGVKRTEASVGIGIGDPVISYMMLRSVIHERRAAGQTLKLVEGRDSTPVDPDQYLETLRQNAIAAVKAQGAVDKTA